MYPFNRLITNLTITTQEKLIILLVDQHNRITTVPECSNISLAYIIGFRVDFLIDLPVKEVHTVTDLTSAVEAVMKYYK